MSSNWCGHKLSFLKTLVFLQSPLPNAREYIQLSYNCCDCIPYSSLLIPPFDTIEAEILEELL
jgi:hypothetical protein